MRIVLDLQAVQAGSRQRGIGRYSCALAQALARNAGPHELLIALNGRFPEAIGPLRRLFDGLVPDERIHLWQTPPGICAIRPENGWLRQAAERLRETFLANLRPDLLHVSSLFEGLDADVATSIGLQGCQPPTAVTLYDLIPLVNRRLYLTNPLLEQWYESKLDHLRRARLWLAISEWSRREGIDYLGLPAESVVNISGAADPLFHPIALAPAAEAELRRRYGLGQRFIMYTGGIDHRKNIEGLIRAYAALPQAVRHGLQLAIVCSAKPDEKEPLERLAAKQGLAPGELVLTGFVPDPDLVALYNLCHLFVFPSWHEGFGLPALEAMACGAAVLASDTTSLPEVVGRSDALFDPRSEPAMTAKLREVLSDEGFRADLRRHGPIQAGRFTWDRSAKRAIEAFERLHDEDQAAGRSRHPVAPPARPRLAYLSPLPPSRSGIADYSAELLPELARHYRIEVIVDQGEVSDPWVLANCAVRTAAWFDLHADRYDRIFYHFGNSEFHAHMWWLLERHPGVVMLHDFFLSGFLARMEGQGWLPHAWTEALYRAHGYGAVRERFAAADATETIYRYPCNLAVLQNATGIIAPSEFSRRLANDWYGAAFAGDWAVVPHLRVAPPTPDRAAARAALGFAEGDFVLCSFGFLSESKLNIRLLEAWLASALAADQTCHLIFVGENNAGAYGARLAEVIRSSGQAARVRITGFAALPLYRQYLAAADLAVQLRGQSRGETSAAVLDCMSHAVPTVVNAHGSAADLPTDSVWMLPDGFADDALVAALEHLRRDEAARHGLGRRGRARVLADHHPRHIADRYAAAIEAFQASPREGVRRLLSSVAGLDGRPAENGAWLALAEALAVSFPLPAPRRQLLIDLSAAGENVEEHVLRRLARELLSQPPEGFRVEPVVPRPEGGYRYARRATLGMLNCPQDALADEPIEIGAGDCLVGALPAAAGRTAVEALVARLSTLGGRSFFFDAEHGSLVEPGRPEGGGASGGDALWQCLCEALAVAFPGGAAARRLAEGQQADATA